MASQFAEEILNRIKSLLNPGTRPGSEETQVKFARREKIIVFIAAYIMALSLWFIINLNGSFNININVPVETGSVPGDMALTEPLPDFVQVSLSGDGWMLFNVYNDPPTVSINVEQGDINLFDQVRQRLNYLQDVDVTKVQPLVLSIDMEERIERRVPVVVPAAIAYDRRYGMVGSPVISPDSVTVSGARSVIGNIREWVVSDTLKIDGVKEDISRTIPLNSGSPLISLSEPEINFFANISEFTEGETTVYINTRNLPRGENVNYTPSSVTIRYDVPLEQYNQVQNMNLYEVYVPYNEILEDSSGYVTPDVELLTDQFQIKLRSYQPKAVAYFSVLEQ